MNQRSALSSTLALFVILWLAGNALRVTLLAIPPLLPAMHHDLELSERAIAALTGLPVLLLALAAVPGSLLISRLGARRALIGGLGLIAVGGALRGVGPSMEMLFAMTFVMGIGIAISQPAMPSLASQWFPRRIGTATAVYSNGLLTGEVVAASLTLPFILPSLGGSWELGLVFWSLPVLVTVALVRFAVPAEARPASGRHARWWPNWRDFRPWQLGIILSCGQTCYFATNAFLPDYLRVTGHPDLIAAALTSVNIGQLPASFLVAAFPDRFVGRRWPFVAAGILAVIAGLGLILTSGIWIVAWAGVLGFIAAFGLILNLALAPILAGAKDVHRLTAGMFTVSYTLAFVEPLIGGTLWDHTGIPATAFLPVLVAGLLMAGFGLGLKTPQEPTVEAASGVPAASL